MALVRWSPFRELRRWDPFREMERLTERMERLFEEFFPTLRREEEREFVWAPAVDVYENDKAYVVEVDLPGLRKEDVRVTVQDGVLTIQGERRLAREEKGGRLSSAGAVLRKVPAELHRARDGRRRPHFGRV